MALPKSVEVTGFIVRRPIHPAAIQYAYPLEGQGTYRRVVRRALGSVLLVECLSPVRSGDCLLGPFHEGLAQERIACETPVDPVLVATAFGNWSDTDVFLHGRGICEAVA